MKELQSEKIAFENAPGGPFSLWSILRYPPKPARTGGALLHREGLYYSNLTTCGVASANKAL